MKLFLALFLTLSAFSLSFAQNEQSPIIEKEINYKNWSYKNVRDGQESNLRDLTKGKKLVIVVYYAPWCPNWRHDVPFLQRFYETYKDKGLEIVGVGEYDPLNSIKDNLELVKATFPAVYESLDRADKDKTSHFQYRTSAGDTRKWGSPWYIFLEPAKFEKNGDTLVKKAHLINGEMIQSEGEKFIREKLGLSATDPKAATASKDKTEVCEPDKPGSKIAERKKP